MLLRFSDGIQIDTQGPVRALKLDDGWYIVGGGMCCPVVDEKAAREGAAKLKIKPEV